MRFVPVGAHGSRVRKELMETGAMVMQMDVTEVVASSVVSP